MAGNEDKFRDPAGKDSSKQGEIACGALVLSKRKFDTDKCRRNQTNLLVVLIIKGDKGKVKRF